MTEAQSEFQCVLKNGMTLAGQSTLSFEDLERSVNQIESTQDGMIRIPVVVERNPGLMLISLDMISVLSISVLNSTSGLVRTNMKLN